MLIQRIFALQCAMVSVVPKIKPIWQEMNRNETKRKRKSTRKQKSIVQFTCLCIGCSSSWPTITKWNREIFFWMFVSMNFSGIVHGHVPNSWTYIYILIRYNVLIRNGFAHICAFASHLSAGPCTEQETHARTNFNNRQTRSKQMYSKHRHTERERDLAEQQMYTFVFQFFFSSIKIRLQTTKILENPINRHTQRE